MHEPGCELTLHSGQICGPTCLKLVQIGIRHTASRGPTTLSNHISDGKAPGQLFHGDVFLIQPWMMLSQLKWALRTQIRRQLTLWKTNPLQALQKQRRGRRHLRFCRETNPQQLHPGKSSYIPADTTELIVSTVNLLVQNCHQDHSTSKGCARHAVMIASAISIPFLTITSIGKTSTRKCVMLASLPTARRRFQEIAIAGNTSSRRTAVFLLRGKW